MLILKVALPVPINSLFDYQAEQIDEGYPPGTRVIVPFGRRELVGIVWNCTTDSSLPPEKIKSINKVLDLIPFFDSHLQDLIKWLSQYYHHPIGEVCATVLPNWFKQKKTLALQKKPTEQKSILEGLSLNQEQEHALNAISKKLNQFQVFLLIGVTASGKTEIYLQAIKKILDSGKQALVLVPEISLTPQTVARFEQRFPGHTAVIHSKITDKKRLDIALNSYDQTYDIIIGTRSAIFTPFNNLGIIVLDEEHDLSFKQQEGLKYSARDVAVRRAQTLNIPIILGSATPSLESLQNAKQNRYMAFYLRHRAQSTTPPKFNVVDLRDQYLDHGLSDSLIKKIKHHLDHNQQVLLFLNRRGYAPVLLCQHCGWHATCQRCDLPFTFHQKSNRLICHHCEKNIKKPLSCPECGKTEIQPIGVGTERIEEALLSLFKSTPILRIDRDSTRKKNQLTELIEKIHSGDPMILVGTQMLAKGHHFPKISLVGIINSDYGFFSSDFRAMERMGQLITQVAGRAGRDEKKTDLESEVIIQTYQPSHPLLTTLLKEGYLSFAEKLLQERQLCQLPPFSYFALVRAEHRDGNLLTEYLLALKKALQPSYSNVKMLGPIAAPMPKKASLQRMQILVSSKQRPDLHKAVNHIEAYLKKHPWRGKITIDIDPQDMI